MSTSFLTRVFSSTAATASLLLLSSFSSAEAASFTFNTSNFTGANAKVSITLDDKAAGEGNIQFTVKMAADATTIGDIRGLFFNISDDSLLSGLRATGSHVTTTAYGAGKISSVGKANLNGDGGNHLFDFGIEIGENGLKGGKDDIQTTTFVLSHTSRALDLSLFAQQDFGVRLTSVGTVGGSRELSSKLVGTSPLPPIQVNPPSPSPSPSPASPSHSSSPSPNPSPSPVSSSPAPAPAPVVITPLPSASPMPAPVPSSSTEIPEPSITAGLVLATAGAIKWLRKKGATVQTETDSLA
ncbi:PEP-CTERM sorting domain-containing protein [Thermocoleostomius sinensis]|uniref:PEP-CTERM sorting domain-containing protein n=1 Tax=Thermocoleostomius sinensis A174 TaxID=2016057 RepID=A0A9E8ZIB7_9CYAN|nr:PEP-CTERM sorting domain-containing protein [Thermocoleostomius sinensis]WAL62324.1 PEP-CTERM sorting domain-containing protein [Thermocoleostomius sinensis A174]